MVATCQFYTVTDVVRAGHTLEPLRCLNPKCSDPQSENVTFNQAEGDAYCSICGEDQLKFVPSSERPVNLIRVSPTARDLMDASVCLWEHILDLRSRPDVSAAFAAQGASEMRSQVLDLADRCHVDYANAVNDRGYDEPFDWGFVPSWVARNIIFSAENGISRSDAN